MLPRSTVDHRDVLVLFEVYMLQLTFFVAVFVRLRGVVCCAVAVDVALVAPLLLGLRQVGRTFDAVRDSTCVFQLNCIDVCIGV